MFCCLSDNAIVVCSVCGKSADKTANQLSIEEAKVWYVKRGDPIYCRKCLIEEKLRLKQELETLKAINNMKNKKKDSKLQLSLRTIKDGKAWKKSESFVSAHKPSQRAMEMTKRAEKRLQSKQEIKEKRKETFSYDLRKELEVRRKLARFEKCENDQKINVAKKVRRMSQDADKKARRMSQDTTDTKSLRGRRRRSSIIDFFKKFSKGGRRASVEEQDIITPVTSSHNSPRSSFDGSRRSDGNLRDSFESRGRSESTEFSDIMTLNNIEEDPSIELALAEISTQSQ